jgi:hypothetical protein
MPSRSAWLRASTLAVASASLPACAGGNAASRLADAPAFEPKGQTKCGVAKSAARPLIVEWSAADRGALESQAKHGVVVVRYEGCEMEVLRQCRARGRYAYTPVTRKEDHLAIRTADELYASIPAHAAQLEGKLAGSGSLVVDMTIVGTWEAERQGVRRDELEGDCERATHAVLGLSAGAFEFSAQAGAEVKAGGKALGVAAGGASSASKELLNRDGYRSACERSTLSDAEPPDGCGALLRVEVAPIAQVNPATLPVGAPYYYTPSSGYAPPAPPPELGPRSGREVGGIIATSVGAAGLGVGLVAGVVALAQKTNLADECTDGHCGPSKADAIGSYHAATTTSTVGFVAGGVLFGSGIVLLATAPPRAKKPAKSAWIAPTLGPLGLGLEGGFR